MRNLLKMFLVSLCILSCDAAEEGCTEPSTITVNIPNNSFFCFKTGSIASNCGLSSSPCCSDILFDPNNFIAVRSVLSDGTKGPSLITSISKSKLCEVASPPTSGYVSTVAADYDMVYIVKCLDNTYARFIVTSFGTFTNGGVSSVQIKYQYPFN